MIIGRTFYWLSFCDTRRQKGTQFLGAAIVEIVDRQMNPADEPEILSALRIAHRLGCNPGGEVQGCVIPPDIEPQIPRSFRGRLLTKIECNQLDLFMRKFLS
jgi:hypothetical protein